MDAISATDVAVLARAAGLHVTAERAALLAPQVTFLLHQSRRLDLLLLSTEGAAEPCPKPSTP